MACFLCPGNERAQGDHNPKYDSPFMFVNDYSAVKEFQEDLLPKEEDDLSRELLRAEGVTGKCYVITFSPAHNLTLADLKITDIKAVITTWTRLYSQYISPSSPLSQVSRSAATPQDQYRWMQIFENKGAAMGCSNPHPHGQVWTTTSLPEEPATELRELLKYREEHGGKHLLQDYAALEQRKNERVVYVNEAFITVCPWWATWPYETMIISKTHKRALVDFTETEQILLAEALSDITRRYDNLFETHFPYSMGIHQAPLSGTKEEIEASYFHMHFYPPLLRSASVRKFLVGYEMLAEPQRDITPEQAAEKLQTCGGELYRNKPGQI
ncbi:MAG: galactose-1-phosphate uridyl transferase [Vezdaea aestivalis]|nr:MAG: galactose-1-phosphate uridyl transferase [Vezdaea aestivalis]